MQCPFTLDVFKNQEKCSYISKGFLKCVVNATISPFHSRQFAYCLHCRQLKSLSWFFDHKRKVRFTPTPQQVLFFDAKFEDYYKDILTEVELLSDVGRLFFEGRQFVRRDTSRDQQQEGPLGLQGESQEACLQFVENETEEVFGQQFVFAGDDDDMEENDTFMENDRMVDCICECFEDFCFVDKTFDLNKFSQLSQTLLELSNSQTGCTSENIQSMKAKILSRLTKKMFVMLSLTKTQMDTLNRFIGRSKI